MWDGGRQEEKREEIEKEKHQEEGQFISVMCGLAPGIWMKWIFYLIKKELNKIL